MQKKNVKEIVSAAAAPVAKAAAEAALEKGGLRGKIDKIVSGVRNSIAHALDFGGVRGAIGKIANGVQNGVAHALDFGRGLFKKGAAALGLTALAGAVAVGGGDGKGRDPSGGGAGGGGESGGGGGDPPGSAVPFLKKFPSGWTAAVNDNGYNIYNQGPDGQKKFYEIITGEKYGNPIVRVEPDKALPLPTGVSYVNAKGTPAAPDQKIGGIICPDARFSLSSPSAPAYELKPDGSLVVADKTYSLATLFHKDKQRFINYDAYFATNKPEQVYVLELEDLPLGEPGKLFATTPATMPPTAA